MINFRFHIVSLIAVFLALALGIVMGWERPCIHCLSFKHILAHVMRRGLN